MKKPTKVWMIVSVVLIFIIAVLFFAAPNIDTYPGNITKATKNIVTSFSESLNTYKNEVGNFPSTSDGLKALKEKPSSVNQEKWHGPYIVGIKDPWGHDFNYRFPGIHNPKSFDLWSYGKDGKEGGKGYDADIGNW